MPKCYEMSRDGEKLKDLKLSTLRQLYRALSSDDSKKFFDEGNAFTFEPNYDFSDDYANPILYSTNMKEGWFSNKYKYTNKEKKEFSKKIDIWKAKIEAILASKL